MKKRSTLFRIDEQVFFTMLGLCVLSLIILGFRYGISGGCYPIKIQLPSDTILVGSRVSFKAETRGAKKFTWDFRDGVVMEEENSSVSHTFKNPGKYTISVTVNEKCSEYFTVVVVKGAALVKRQTLPMFLGPSSIPINETVSFEDTSSLGKSWEWQFEEGGQIESTSKKATHTYSTAGRHIITLTVNGRADMTVWRYIDVIDKSEEENKTERPRENASRRPRIIEVPSDPSEAPITSLPAPVVPDPEPEPVKKAPMITGPELQEMLKQVAKGSKTAQDFSDYLCGQLDQQVTYNGKITTFRGMCIEMEKVKDKKVKDISVVIIRNQTTQCIQSLQVKLTRRGLFN